MSTISGKLQYSTPALGILRSTFSYTSSSKYIPITVNLFTDQPVYLDLSGRFSTRHRAFFRFQAIPYTYLNAVCVQATKLSPN